MVTESKKIAKKIVSVLQEKKAKDIELINVETHTIISDYFVVATGVSITHVKALSDEIQFQLSKDLIDPLHVEGHKGDGWILIDYGSVIVHIFSKQLRNFYNIEELYENNLIDRFE